MTRARALWLGAIGQRARRVALAVVAFAAAFAVMQWWDLTLPSLGASRYQAVFLASGQAYFGRYFDRIGPYAKIEGVYYIQTSKSDDPDKPAESRIVRRGSELHGPQERVLIMKSSILFVEDLRPDSPVARFIDQDQAAKSGR